MSDTSNWREQKRALQLDRADGFATASIVCALVGIVIFGGVLGVLAVVFGIIALSNETERTGRSITGIIIGIIEIIYALVVVIEVFSYYW